MFKKKNKHKNAEIYMQRLNMLYPFSSLPVSSINKIYYKYFHLHSTFVHSKEQKRLWTIKSLVKIFLHTPCSSNLSSCSGTLGELEACLRHWMLSSGITYSSTSLRGRPLAVPCLAVDGIASSKIAPLSVVSCNKCTKHF